MSDQNVHRIDVGECALGLLDTPYLWDGKEPGGGIDCSGVVTYALWIAGHADWRQTHNAQNLFDCLAPIDSPNAFDLAFWRSPTRVEHVMMVMGELVYGASGGDSDCVTLDISRARGARVRLRSGTGYRPGFCGFRRLPVID